MQSTLTFTLCASDTVHPSIHIFTSLACRTDEEAQWDGREGFVSIDLAEIQVCWGGDPGALLILVILYLDPNPAYPPAI